MLHTPADYDARYSASREVTVSRCRLYWRQERIATIMYNVKHETMCMQAIISGELQPTALPLEDISCQLHWERLLAPLCICHRLECFVIISFADKHKKILLYDHSSCRCSWFDHSCWLRPRRIGTTGSQTKRSRNTVKLMIPLLVENLLIT
jgi:hypothetical protein